MLARVVLLADRAECCVRGRFKKVKAVHQWESNLHSSRLSTSCNDKVIDQVLNFDYAGLSCHCPKTVVSAMAMEW